MKIIVTFTSLLLLVISISASAQDGSWRKAPSNCVPGLHKSPIGPFAVMLYCEDALGVYLAVIHDAPIGAPAAQSGKWSLEDRYWSDPLWASDVTGFKWSQDGRELFVSTDEIYGSGGLFELYLFQRKVKQILPKSRPVSINKPGPGYSVDGKLLKP